MHRYRFPVVLASASPRRQELLRNLAAEFEVLPADVDEDAATTADPFETAARLAEMKAKAVQAFRPDCLIIGGDTVVALPQPDGSFIQLSKPNDEQDACRMLSELSGRSHWVITGCSVCTPTEIETRFEKSLVTFRELSSDEIQAYVATGEPMDKAGAYAVQAGGGTFIRSIEGSRTNVIGLPLELLGEMLLPYRI